jgi:hypothetical protein
MTAAEITRRVKFHNAMQWFLCIGMVPLSLVLWWISWWFFRLAIYLPLELFYEGAWTASFFLAWPCLIPLAVDGIRHARPLFDMEEYMKSDFFNNFVSQSESGSAMNAYFGDPIEIAFLISQVLYCAPRAMVLALQAWRSFLPDSETSATDASRILAELRTSRKWIPAHNYRQSGAALMVLNDLELIWTEVRDGQVELRYPPGENW